jgi:hypothetical protein
MRVSLRPPTSQSHGATAVGEPPRPLLDPTGPAIVIGAKPSAFDLTQPVAASASTLFGPRGAALAAPSGPLVVADTGHHRLMIWRQCPIADHAPADIVLGQADFYAEGRNAKGEAGAATLNVPTGVAATPDILAVADPWNHRILLWHRHPERDNQPADVVLGQADFTSTLANRGGDPRADTLNWCYGVAIIGDTLVVCDTGNRRVLVWGTIPTENGRPADLVLGQDSMTCRDENGGRGVDARGMRWPHGVVMVGAALFVADSGNNRVMAWTRMPTRDGAPCDVVLGQADMITCEHNRARYLPDATCLNMPYSCAALDDRLLVADTASSRLLGFAVADLATGMPAERLSGQHDFGAKGDNRWSAPVRDSLCWPYGLTTAGTTAVVADSGNNRVLLWEAAS